MTKASVGVEFAVTKQSIHDGPLAERVGQRQARLLAHAVAAAMTLAHGVAHEPDGLAQLVYIDPTSAAIVEFICTVAKHELHAIPLSKTVGQRHA